MPSSYVYINNHCFSDQPPTRLHECSMPISYSNIKNTAEYDFIQKKKCPDREDGGLTFLYSCEQQVWKLESSTL